jgi:hypothetical protein
VNVDQLVSQLNGPSRVLAEELFRRLPAWIAYAQVIRSSVPTRSEPGRLMVHVPSPIAGRNHWLQVEVEGNTFATYYNFTDPFFPWEGQFIFGPGEEREAALEAVDWLADIVEGHVVLVEERIGFLPWSRDTALEPIRRDELTAGRRQRVVSWDGTFDEPSGARDGAG